MEHIITGYTRLVGLLAYPIKHSKSPRMHNLAFAKLGIDGVYLTFDTISEDLEKNVKAMRSLDAMGFNVSMPNKQAIIPLLDELSEEARIIGAVNTVSNVNGVLKGYNTDGMGCVLNLEQNGVDFKGKKVIVGGAGGAGSAVAVQIALSGAKEIVIFDAVESLATKLVNIINENVENCKASCFVYDEQRLIEEMQSAYLYVDASSLGMKPHEDEAVVSSSKVLPKDLIVADITYVPLKTKLLKLAEERGCKTVTGIGMMYNQGAAAFKIWTGEDMPLDYIKEQMNKE